MACTSLCFSAAASIFIFPVQRDEAGGDKVMTYYLLRWDSLLLFLSVSAAWKMLALKPRIKWDGEVCSIQIDSSVLSIIARLLHFMCCAYRPVELISKHSSRVIAWSSLYSYLPCMPKWLDPCVELMCDASIRSCWR